MAALPALLALSAACGVGSRSTGPTAPTILTPPASDTVSEGQQAGFSVTASGTAPLQYQWRRGGVAILGATGATLAIPAVALSDDQASFAVSVSNAAGSILSAAATP